jgi:hypothetical protein
MTTARRAAEPLLSNLPTPNPNAPGQFAFADSDRVRKIMERAGWNDIVISPVDVEGQITEQDLMSYVIKLGPVGLALKEVDEATRVRVTEVVRTAFQPFIRNGAARVPMACWRISAARHH